VRIIISFQMSLITNTVKLPANRDLCLKWQPSSLQRPPSFVRLSSPKSGWRWRASSSQTRLPWRKSAPEPPNNLTKNDGYAVQSLVPVPVPVVFPSLKPKIDDSKGKLEASVQDRAHVINQLLALWSPKVSTILPIDGVIGVDQRPDAPEMKKMTVEEQMEEIVELFPKRSRPY